MDFRAHFFKIISQVHDFRLTGGVIDHGAAVRENRGHHHVRGPENAGTEGASQINPRAFQALHLRDHITMIERDLGAERLDAF